MSRGFDVDDFRESDSSRDVNRGSSPGWNSGDSLAEIHTLSEVGKFRVVATKDLTQFAYNDDGSCPYQ
jgi:hypothetical protein